MDSVITGRVANGAAWLDENFPGWEREIDLGTLDLSDCTMCVCGQSLRKFVGEEMPTGYDVAMKRVVGKDNMYDNRAWGGRWAEEHGFNPQSTWENERLETAWLELIKERFSTGNLSDGL